MKYSIHMGINSYQSSPLKVCVKDAYDMEQYFSSIGFKSLLILDNAATRVNILDQLDLVIKKMKKKDILVFTFSGHGTFVTDESDDEDDDQKDEAIVPYDYDQGNLIFDDELNALFVQCKGQIIMISDSCHSGSVTRSGINGSFGRVTQDRKVRYLETEGFRKSIKLEPTNKVSNAILISGCKDHEYSFEGEENGALTEQFLNAAYRKPKTYLELFNMIRKKLPSNLFPQSPQLIRKKSFFKDDAKKELWT